MANPTYENDLVLLSTFIRFASNTRLAELTYAVNDAGANLSAQEWADAAQNVFQTAWKGTLSDSAVIEYTTALKGDGTSTFTVGRSTAAGTAGTDSGTKTPSNCALLIRKNTAFGGRENRGRMYIPWLTNKADVGTTGIISGGDVSSFQSDADTFLGGLAAGADNYMCIANRHFNLPWDNPDRRLVSVTKGPEVTSLVVESVIATQRRRLRS